MYGMIHRAAREMVKAQAGDEAWEAISARTGLGESAFVSAQAFPDEVTFALIGAISETLDLPVPELLEAFGRYWISFAERSSYAPMMRLAGDDLVSFLSNLDRMHAGIQGSLPDARLPSFQLVEVTDDGLRVAYRSPREGLETFVVGLLAGLMERFSVQGTISQIVTPDGVDFLIRHSD